MSAPLSSDARTRAPILNAPAVVKIILVIFLAVHASQILGGEANQTWVIFNFGLHPLQVFDREGWATAWLWFPAWTKLLTYVFLHFDLTHLILNSLWFLVFGTLVARRTGTWRFLVLFVLTSAAGGILHVLLHAGSMVPVIGASGMVSGMMGASFRFLLRGWHEVPDPALLPLTHPRIVLATIVFFVINMAFGLLGALPDGSGSIVAWEAHMGGYLAGLVLFPLFDRRGPAGG